MDQLFDVIVVGGGPAGISAGLELSRRPDLKIALFEGESELGGMPRSCHIFFGMRDRKRIYRGPTYARKLRRLIERTPVQIYTRSTVQQILPGNAGIPHRVAVASPAGMHTVSGRFIILATGCFESSRQARFIPGTRPAGIFTTGTLQQVVNLRHQKPGRRALVVGSEHVALSCVLTLRRAGMSIAGIVEEDRLLQTYPLPARAMATFFGFPIYKGTAVKSILGTERVEGVLLWDEKTRQSVQLECDTVILTGKFLPDAQLIDDTAIRRDPFSRGPAVDMHLMTSIPGIFAAGNILRGAAMHDRCALEGKKAAENILARLQGAEFGPSETVSLRAEPPLRYVVPQKTTPAGIPLRAMSWNGSGYYFQTKRTLTKAVLEAWSADNKIWERRYRRLIARTSCRLPVEKFDWASAVPGAEILLRIG